MTALRLTMLLGPRETVEAAELAMPDIPHTLAAAFPLDAWDPDEVERLLMMAGDVFRQAIMAGKHEEPPPPPKRLPPEVEEAMREQKTFVAKDDGTLNPATIELVPGAITHRRLVRDTWGDPTPAERVAIEAGAPIGSLRMEVARAIEPEAWAAIDASLKKADAVLAVVERRRGAPAG